MRTEHSLWPSKYRPKTLEEYACNDEVRRLFAGYIERQDIDNLLLHGIQGTGKTSGAKLLTSNIECDSIYINASDERSIDVIRDRVVRFAETRTMNNLKIIILDEAEAITYQGQNALKSVMEEHDQYVRFILTTNEPDKLNKAIRSRCKSIQFDGLEKKLVGKLLYDILIKEDVKFEMDDIKKLVNTHYPDLRIMIRDAQSFTTNGVLKVPDKIFTSTSEYDSIIELLVAEPQADTFTKIRQLIADQNIKTFDRLYSYMYEKIDLIPVKRRTKTILAIGQAVYQQNFVVDKEITFMACVAQII